MSISALETATAIEACQCDREASNMAAMALWLVTRGQVGLGFEDLSIPIVSYPHCLLLVCPVIIDVDMDLEDVDIDGHINAITYVIM